MAAFSLPACNTAGREAGFIVLAAPGHGRGLAEYVLRIQSDLVVLGKQSRGKRGYARPGSTVEPLLREIPFSALAVRPPGSDAATAGESREHFGKS